MAKIHTALGTLKGKWTIRGLDLVLLDLFSRTLAMKSTLFFIHKYFCHNCVENFYKSGNLPEEFVEKCRKLLVGGVVHSSRAKTGFKIRAMYRAISEALIGCENVFLFSCPCCSSRIIEIIGEVYIPYKVKRFNPNTT